MGFDLSTLKDLRERGAGVQMQDDVANFVGGFDSPLFYPTVDFILKIKEATKEVEVEQVQGIDLSDFGVPEVYDPSFFEKVSIKAAKNAVQNDGKMTEPQQLTLLNYLDNMEIQRADLMGVLGASPELVGTDAVFNPRAVNPKRSPSQGKGLISFFQKVVENMRNLKLRIITNDSPRQVERSSLTQRVKDLVARTVFREARMKMEYRDKIGTLEGGSGIDELLNDGSGQEGGGKKGAYDLDRREDRGQEVFREDKVSIHDVADKYEQAEAKYSDTKQAIEKNGEKAGEEVGISQGIDRTIQQAKMQKQVQDVTDKGEDKEQGKEKMLQREIRIRQMRLRVQQTQQTKSTRDAIKDKYLHGQDHHDEHHEKAKQKKQSEENVKNMTGTDAVRNLQGLGVSNVNDTITSATSLKTDPEVAKKQDMQK